MAYRVPSVLAVAAALVLATGCTAAAPTAGAVAFVHATVIDANGGVPLRDQTVIVTADRIVEVRDASEVAVPAGAEIVDAAGKFLIPGLWDLHVHTRYEGIDHLRLLIANGITSARDMGAPWDHLAEINRWRDAIADGERIGPRLLTGGPLIDGPGSIWSHAAEVADAEAGRSAVRRLRAEGADFAKVYAALDRETFFAIAEEANLLGLPVAGHVPISVGVAEATAAGLRSIEHLTGVFEAVSDDDDDLPASGSEVTIDTAELDALAALLSRNETAVVPTLSVLWVLTAAARRDAAVETADALRYVPATYRQAWRDGRRPELGDMTARFESSVDMVGLLHARGVSVLAGTDTVKPFFVPGFALHDELRLLVDAGLSEMEAIQSATRDAARFAGFDDVGTIEPGMVADLVLLDADPLESIDNTRRIATVVANGRVFDEAELSIMLAEIADAAAGWSGTPTGR